MRTSTAGVALIKEFEGVRLEAYLCPAGIPTIGVGHTSAAGPPDVNLGDSISEDQAEEILRRDLRAVERQVMDLVDVDLEQGQFDALVSFTFNLGQGALKSSTLLKRVNAGRFDEVPRELMKWTKARDKSGQLVDLPGLVRRRRAEAALWRGIDDTAPPVIDETRATPEPPQPPKTMARSKEGNGAIVAGVGSAAGAATVIENVSTGVDATRGLMRVIESPRFWVLVVCLAGAAAGAAVWYWRRRRLREDGA